MTGDEIERAIQFILESQAKNEAQAGRLGAHIGELGTRVEELGARLGELGGRADQLTSDVAQLTGNMGQVTDLVGRMAENTRVFVERVNGRFERLETAMTEHLNVFVSVDERHITDDTRHHRPAK